MDWIRTSNGLVALAVVTVVVLSACTVVYLMARRRRRPVSPATLEVPTIDHGRLVADALSIVHGDPDNQGATDRLTAVIDRAAADTGFGSAATVGVVAGFLGDRRRVSHLAGPVWRSRMAPAVEQILDRGDPGDQLNAISVVVRLGHPPESEVGAHLQRLTGADDVAVARSAGLAEAEFDPASGLNLLYDRLSVDGLWAAEQIKVLLEGGSYREWVARYGPRRAAQVVGLITDAARSGSPEFRLRAVEVLELMPDRAARVALSQLARVRRPGSTRPVTGV